MNPIEQAERLVSTFDAHHGTGMSEEQKESLAKHIAVAVLEACRDQREACAEAIRHANYTSGFRILDDAITAVKDTPLPDLKPLS